MKPPKSDTRTAAPAGTRLAERTAVRTPEAQTMPTLKGAETRRQILLAAANLFREKGYKATTLRDIAELADMGAGSMYYYFSSKDAILHEVLDIGIATIDDAVRAAVAALPADATPVARLREAIRADLRTLLQASEYTPAYTRLYNQLPGAIKRRDHPRRVAYFAYWRGLVTAAQDAGQLRRDLPVEVFVEFLVGSLSRTTEWFNPKAMSVDDLAVKIGDWMLEGVAQSLTVDGTLRKRAATLAVAD
jgi:AcrR family transcriptional regulator